MFIGRNPVLRRHHLALPMNQNTDFPLEPFGWKVSHERLEKRFSFSSYTQALDFVVRIAELAEQHQHHPELRWSYITLDVALRTHDAQAVTEKDWALARAIEALQL